MTTKIEREAFEAVFSKPPYEFHLAINDENSAWPGNYRNYAEQCAWEGWQAARASQVAAPPAQPAIQDEWIDMDKYLATPQPAEQTELSDAVKIVQDLIDSHVADSLECQSGYCDIVAGMEAARNALLAAAKGGQS